ncbi:MAG: hypothetical protein KGJ59_08035 [Bacteroidota bacterium]|nr:hypothetical protein [Bacteroidota bacterium]
MNGEKINFPVFVHLLIRSIVPMLLVIVLQSSQLLYCREVVLQDKKLLVAFDKNTGALSRMINKTTGWVIERRAGLAMSFRLFVPLPDRRYNFVLGQDQKAASVEKISDHEIQIEWKNLKSEYSGVLPIALTATITLNDGALTFDASLENNSSLTVETIDYPYFGDFNPPSKNTSMSARTMWYGNLGSDEIFPRFSNEKGYWGDFYPTKTFDSFRSLFCLIQSPKEGLYVEMKDPTQPYYLQYTFEQHPADFSSITNLVPHEDKIPGKPLSGKSSDSEIPVHLEFRACHFIYAHPNTATRLAPVVMECYKGDWHSGVDLYKAWRATWYKAPYTPGWIKDVNSWQQLQINSPEQDYRVKYTELIKYGEECAKNGVKAIQLVGWNKGGQDGGDPMQDTDPGLGTTQELKEAIAKIQALGVKMILFGKLNWADKTTEEYKTEFYKYACTDPYGIPYEQGGYSYYTPVQLAGINNHRRAVMDFLDPDYRNAATKEFEKLLDLSASGWLFDENCHHGPVKYSFATDHDYTAPGFIYKGDLPMADQLRAAADKKDGRDFLFAGEGFQDWLRQDYSASYFRINENSTPVDRYIDPQAPMVIAVTGFDDREMINFCLLDRYIIEYEPYNFKGEITAYPLTLAYGKKVDELRRKYKEYLWDADFQDTKGADVNADGKIRYSVFVTKSGKRAVVVANLEEKKLVTAKVEIPKHGKLVVVSQEDQNEHATTGTVKIPALSAAVIIEK